MAGLGNDGSGGVCALMADSYVTEVGICWVVWLWAWALLSFKNIKESVVRNHCGSLGFGISLQGCSILVVWFALALFWKAGVSWARGYENMLGCTHLSCQVSAHAEW